MKTLKKNCQGLYLQDSKKRWKWMAGATAATAAGVTASQASTITINLISDYLSFAGGNHLNAVLIDRNCGRRKRWVGKAAHRNGDVLLSALLNVEHCRAAR